MRRRRRYHPQPTHGAPPRSSRASRARGLRRAAARADDAVASSLRLFPETTRAVARAALAAAKPELTAHVLSDDEVLALLGGRLARALLSQAFVVRAELTVEGKLFAPDRAALFLRASEVGARLPLVPLWPHWLADAVTHERCADTREVVTGVDLPRLRLERDVRAPTAKELLASCPDAVALAEKLKAPAREGAAVETFVVRRPEGALGAPDYDFDVALHRDATCVGARLRVGLSSTVGTWSLAELRDVTVREDDGGSTAPRSCFLPEECELGGHCTEAKLPRTWMPSVVGLVPPKGPDRPTTLAESENHRPPWDDEPFAPTVDLPATLSSAGLSAPYRFVACHVHRKDRAPEVATFLSGSTAVTRKLVYDDATGGFLVSFPKVDLPVGGTFAFSLRTERTSPREARKVVVKRSDFELTLADPYEGPESIVCRGEVESVLEEEAFRRWARANDQLEPFEGPSPRTREGADDARMRASLRDLAGLVGWDDPRVLGLVARFASAATRAER